MIYVMGSLRNPKVVDVTVELEQAGYEVFSEWYGTGPEADDFWQKYEKARGRSYMQALKGWAARNIFEFDKFHLDRCDAGILVYPAGKSAHIELGYLIGRGKPAYILLDGEPERYEVMANFATGVYLDLKEIMNEFANLRRGPVDTQGTSEVVSCNVDGCWVCNNQTVVGPREHRDGQRPGTSETAGSTRDQGLAWGADGRFDGSSKLS